MQHIGAGRRVHILEVRAVLLEHRELGLPRGDVGVPLRDAGLRGTAACRRGRPPFHCKKTLLAAKACVENSTQGENGPRKGLKTGTL